MKKGFTPILVSDPSLPFSKKGKRFQFSGIGNFRKQVSGFTLIELLVVIAIIGILSSVVLANLNNARQKARDTKRIADIKQLQLALELYFDNNNGKYPRILSSDSGNATELAPTYIPNIPTPPSGAPYVYVPLNAGCNSYHLGAVLEVSGNIVLSNDSDAPVGTVATAGNCGGTLGSVPASDFHGLTADCVTTSAGPSDLCFDVTP